MRRRDGRWQWAGDGADLTDRSALHQPFPHVEPFNPGRRVPRGTGPARGHMWADDTADDGGYPPLRDHDGAPLGFARWHRRWLDEAEAQVSQDRPAGAAGGGSGTPNLT